jgi:hypothetical protein
MLQITRLLLCQKSPAGAAASGRPVPPCLRVLAADESLPVRNGTNLRQRTITSSTDSAPRSVETLASIRRTVAGVILFRVDHVCLVSGGARESLVCPAFPLVAVFGPVAGGVVSGRGGWAVADGLVP